MTALTLIVFQMIGNLTKLTSIDASCNDIIEIADEIGRCTHLTDLSFNQNSIEVSRPLLHSSILILCLGNLIMVQSGRFSSKVKLTMI